MTADTLRRQWQLLRSIPRAPKKVTVTTLLLDLKSKGFEVTRRTVERDLRWLTDVFDLTCDERSRPHGWSWAQDSLSLGLPRLSSGEALSLLMTREHLRSLMPASSLAQLRHYFELAEQRLGRSTAAASNDAPEAHWQERVRVVPASQPLLAPAMDADVLATVQQALLDQVQCEVTYQRRTDPKPATYPIHPLGLVQRGALLYLVCTIKTYSDIKLLAVHRMAKALLLTDPVRVPLGFDLDAYLASGAMGWNSGAEQVNLSIAFDATAAEHLHETPLSTNQTLLDMPCGRVQLNASVPYTPQLLWWLRGFGAAAEVLAPESLRVAMREEVLQMKQLYLTLNKSLD